MDDAGTVWIHWIDSTMHSLNSIHSETNQGILVLHVSDSLSYRGRDQEMRWDEDRVNIGNGVAILIDGFTLSSLTAYWLDSQLTLAASNKRRNSLGW